MMVFLRQSLGTYKAFSWPPDYIELVLDKMINPIWFVALFHFLARYTVPVRDPFEALVSVAVLFAGALAALRAPEIFRAEAETQVLPNLILSARAPHYLVTVRLLPLFAECVAVLGVTWAVGLLLYGADVTLTQSLAALGYGLLALVSLCCLGFLFAALSLLFDDYVMISNMCWSVVILFSGALFPAAIYPDGVGWYLVQTVVPGNASLTALHLTLSGAEVAWVSYFLRELCVCAVVILLATRIFERGVMCRLERT